MELIPVESGDKFGYINPKGEYIINPQYENASFFWDGRARIRTDAGVGYINSAGEQVINPIYKDGTIFSEGIAWVVKPNGMPTAIDTDGDELFTCKVDEVVNFSEGMAVVKVNGKYGFVDRKGEMVIPATYTIATPFSDGLAAVLQPDGEYFMYINKEGETVVMTQSNSISGFANGRAIVYIEKSGYGIIDKEGKYIVNPQFGELKVAGEDIYSFQLQGSNEYGYCDGKGKIVINPQFKEALPFLENDLAPVKIGNKFGYIDKKGKIAINPQFDLATPYVEGLAMVVMNQKIGLIDQEGKYTVNPQFNDMGNDALRIFWLYNLRNNNNAAAWNTVETDFFDAEGLAQRIINEVVAADKVDGLDYQATLGDVMERYELSDYNVSSNMKLVNKDLTPDLSMMLRATGEFYDKESDGWFGYNRVLNKDRIPSTYQVTLTLSGKGYGKEDILFEALLRAYGLSDSLTAPVEVRLNGRKMVIEKEEGKLTLTIFLS